MQHPSPTHPLCLDEEFLDLGVERLVGVDPRHRPADLGPGLLEGLHQLRAVLARRRPQNKPVIDPDSGSRAPQHRVPAAVLSHQGYGSYQGRNFAFAVATF